MAVKYDDTRYAYATGRIQAIAAHMMDASKLDAMIAAPGRAEAEKIAREAGYEGVTYEQMPENELSRTYSLLRELSPEQGMIDIFLLKNDYHNLKVLIKQEFLANGTDYTHLLIPGGVVESKTLVREYTERTMDEWHPIMRDAVEQCIDMMRTTPDPQKIDILLDRALYAHMTSLADEFGNEFVCSLVAVMADLANIRAALRVRRLGKGADFLEQILLDGGNIAHRQLLDAMEETDEAFADTLSATPYGSVVTQAGSVAAVEAACEHYLDDFVRDALYRTTGIEPLIGYLMKKEREIKAVRVILTGKANDLPAPAIRERIMGDV